MSDSSDDATELEEERMRSIVRGALRGGTEAPDVLAGVQKKLRERSDGKFYADGWSTARHAPVNTYFVTSLLMLLALGVIYAVLSPLSGEPERVQNQAAPINVVSPAPKASAP
jgi:hypothetical protein